MRLLRARARGVRARRGRAPVGRGRRRVPRLPVRHLGDEPRALPPARGGGGVRAGAPADARQQPLLHRARDAPRAGAVALEPRRQGVLLQLRARRRTRRRSSSRARRARAARWWSSTAPSTGAPTARCRRRRRRPSRRRSRRWCPASSAVAPEPAALAAAVSRAHRGGADRADPGRGRRARALRRAAARPRARRATSTARR